MTTPGAGRPSVSHTQIVSDEAAGGFGISPDASVTPAIFRGNMQSQQTSVIRDASRIPASSHTSPAVAFDGATTKLARLQSSPAKTVLNFNATPVYYFVAPTGTSFFQILALEPHPPVIAR